MILKTSHNLCGVFCAITKKASPFRKNERYQRIFATSSRKTGQHRIIFDPKNYVIMGPAEGQKTLLQAYRSGYIPKEGATTVAVWCGQGYHHYYNPEDLRKHPRAAAARLKKYMADQRAARKAAKEAEEQRYREEAAEEAARRKRRANTKTRYQWARMGYIANDNATWEWGLSLGREYGDSYKYTHITNVHVGTPEELEPWWRFFLMELELKGTDNAFVKLRTELLNLSPEYPSTILDIWVSDENYYNI